MTRRADERQRERAGVPRRFRQVAWEAVTVPEIFDRMTDPTRDVRVQAKSIRTHHACGAGRTRTAFITLPQALSMTLSFGGLRRWEAPAPPSWPLTRQLGHRPPWDFYDRRRRGPAGALQPVEVPLRPRDGS